MQETRTYEATAYFDGKWWVFEIPELRTTVNGARSVAMGQARSRIKLNQTVREVAALWLDADDASVAVNVIIVEKGEKP
jgi:hypothetical protein